MSKIPSPLFQMESWAIAFPVFSLINFGIVYNWPIHQSLDKKIWWFTIIFLFYPKVLHSVQILIFLGGAATSTCHFLCPSVACIPYLRNRTSSNHGFWYTCVKWYLQVFFFYFFEILIFRTFRGTKIAQNEK